MLQKQVFECFQVGLPLSFHQPCAAEPIFLKESGQSDIVHKLFRLQEDGCCCLRGQDGPAEVLNQDCVMCGESQDTVCPEDLNKICWKQQTGKGEKEVAG